MRTLKLVLTEMNNEVNECNVPIVHTAQEEITDTELKQIAFGKTFDLMTTVKKLSDRLDKHIESNEQDQRQERRRIMNEVCVECKSPEFAGHRVNCSKNEPLPVRSESTGWVFLEGTDWHNVLSCIRRRESEKPDVMKTLKRLADDIESQLNPNDNHEAEEPKEKR